MTRRPEDEAAAVEVLMPRRLMAGRMSAWLTPDDRIVVAFLQDGLDEENTQRVVIPPHMLRIASRALGVDLRALVSQLGDEGEG